MGSQCVGIAAISPSAAQDPGWTQALGDAVLAQWPDVIDAVQKMGAGRTADPSGCPRDDKWRMVTSIRAARWARCAPLRMMILWEY